MTDLSPDEAALALTDAQAARNATWNAAVPLRPARLIAIFASYVLVMTLVWWMFAQGTAASWTGAIALTILFIGTIMFIERRNPKARPKPTAPFKEQMAATGNLEFVAMILLAVWPGLWVMNNQPPLWIIALIVAATAVASIPLLLRQRRKMQSLPA